MTLPKSKEPSEENKSYIRLKAAVTDSLMLMKFKFFCQHCKSYKQISCCIPDRKANGTISCAVYRRYQTFPQLDILIKGHIKQS